MDGWILHCEASNLIVLIKNKDDMDPAAHIAQKIS
jgi:hypothetical protein